MKFKTRQSVVMIEDIHPPGGDVVRNVRVPYLVREADSGRYLLTPDCGDPICEDMEGCRCSPGDFWVDEDQIHPLTEEEATMDKYKRIALFESLCEPPWHAPYGEALLFVSNYVPEKERFQVGEQLSSALHRAMDAKSGEPIDTELQALKKVYKSLQTGSMNSSVPPV
jgi:hypothetical protein